MLGFGILILTSLGNSERPIVLASTMKAFQLRQKGWQPVSQQDALWALDCIDRWASSGLRDFVSDARVSSFPLSDVDDHELLGIVRNAIRDGRVAAFRKGDAVEAPSANTVRRRLVSEIATKTNGRLSYSGRQYKLVADLDLDGLPDRNYHEVVGHADAKKVLDALAAEPTMPTELLAKASADLTKDWRKPFTEPDGLILLRRNPPPRRAAANDEPAITPSQMRALMEKGDDEPTIRLVNVEAPTFVPGAETLRISYAIDGPVAKAATVVMIVETVPPNGKRAVVETLAVAGPYAASGEVNWDGKAAATPGGFITLKDSPYEVTVELTSKSGKKSTSSPGKLRIEVKDIKIVVDDSGPLAVADQWKTTVAALIDELKKSGMPGDCEGRVIIESPLFRKNPKEMADDTSFSEYEAAVGAGPAVPFLARITLKSKSGEGKRSAPVLIGTRLLWDFKLESSADLDGSLGGRGMHAAAKTFVKKAAGFEESATQPKGTSAHLKVGGYRAKSADRAAAGPQWTSGDEWNMTAPSQRDWSAFTDCGDGADDSADSAVYFRPGRMAGDTHKVRAIVDLGENLDVKDEAAPAGAAPPHRSNTVKLVTWRRIPIVATWIVGAKTTPITTPPLTAEYKKAALLIEPAPGVAPQDIGAKWSAEYKTVVAEKANDPFLGKALESDPQGYPVRFREFMDYWELTNPDAGFFGALWERIRGFFGASDKQEYKEKCDDAWFLVTAKVAQRIPIPDNGITAVKFGHNGPHNQNPKAGGFTAGAAAAIQGLTDRTKAIFFQFTVRDDADTFIHEVGHSLFLTHAPGTFDPRFAPKDVRKSAHDKNQVCIMSYASNKKYFCGLCYLKLAGWDYLQVTNDGNIKP